MSGRAFRREFHDFKVVDHRLGGAARLLQTASWRLDKAKRLSAGREGAAEREDLSRDVAPRPPGPGLTWREAPLLHLIPRPFFSEPIFQVLAFNSARNNRTASATDSDVVQTISCINPRSTIPR